LSHLNDDRQKGIYRRVASQGTVLEMKVTVVLNKRSEVLDLDDDATIEDMLGKLGLYPDAHIVLRGKTPVPLNDRPNDGDELRIIKVASGG
jgi:sulfur carrier protein ThiS